MVFGEPPDTYRGGLLARLFDRRTEYFNRNATQIRKGVDGRADPPDTEIDTLRLFVLYLLCLDLLKRTHLPWQRSWA